MSLSHTFLQFILDKHTKDLESINQKGIDQIIQKYQDSSTDSQPLNTSLKLLSSICANLALMSYDYSLLGGRILMESIYNEVGMYGDDGLDQSGKVLLTFSDNLKTLRETKNGRISNVVHDFIEKNQDFVNNLWDPQYDFAMDYSSVLSFEKRGLERSSGRLIEVPSFLFLRASVGVNIFNPRTKGEFDATNKFFEAHSKTLGKTVMENRTNTELKNEIAEYYKLLIERKISLPGPILLHAGSERNQMASCYLQYCSDSLTGEEYNQTGKVGGIMKAMTQLAMQSKGGGGNAIAIHDIRSSGSVIKTTNGHSNGILPFMKMFDATIGSVNQSGKRAGTCAVYLEPWHMDIMEYLDAGNHFTIEEKRCKNLFYGLFVNDLFFKRLTEQKAEAKWTLFDPQKVLEHLPKPLSEYYGEEFVKQYQYLESLGIGKTVKLMEIWLKVVNLFQTTGNPYIVNKDQINLKSNQKNLGTIKSSNLCTEIALVSNEDETAVCVLSSICLGKFVTKDLKVDYNGIIQASRIATRNLNNVIDLQYYPTPETRNSCLARRAIGVGAQGLADLLASLDLVFTSPEAKQINKNVYEAIYYGCLKESMELAKQAKTSYLGFEGSPLSQGILQFDMWNQKSSDLMLSKDWQELTKDIKQYGVLNSEVTALAPTASSSIRMGNNEMHEPFTRNLYVRQTIFGSIQVVNRFLMADLRALGLWNKQMITDILANDGSVQAISSIPEHLRDKYKTAYEIAWQDLIDMMADRSAFVSQSSSFNHFTPYDQANTTTYTQKIIYGWKKGLKTLSYYMHTETASTAKKEMSAYSGSTPIEQKPKNNQFECVGCSA
jgi:ribonucleoside-diphosphate reductase alpha subunit